MTSIGPYDFTDQDVDTTLQAGWALFDQLEAGLPADVVALVQPHRATVQDALDSVLAGSVAGIEIIDVVWSEWRAAMAVIRASGALGPAADGTVTGLFWSDGGVPKHAVEAVDVDFGGVVGDRQGNRKHHGRPFQALCLWSVDVIDGFRAAGHPIAPGLAGENVTIAAIPWDRVRPGAILRIGEVLAEASSYAVPCRHNAPWFTGGRFDLMHHKHGPVSRVYATVLEPGRIAVGDQVTVAPPP